MSKKLPDHDWRRAIYGHGVATLTKSGPNLHAWTRLGTALHNVSIRQRPGPAGMGFVGAWRRPLVIHGMHWQIRATDAPANRAQRGRLCASMTPAADLRGCFRQTGHNAAGYAPAEDCPRHTGRRCTPSRVRHGCILYQNEPLVGALYADPGLPRGRFAAQALMGPHAAVVQKGQVRALIKRG